MGENVLIFFVEKITGQTKKGNVKGQMAGKEEDRPLPQKNPTRGSKQSLNDISFVKR